MSNIKLNCCVCGKELGLGSRVSTDGVLWRCEDCAMKQIEEYDNKDKKIFDLEAKLAEAKKEISEYIVVVDVLHKQLSNKCDFCEEQYKQQLAEKDRQLEVMRELKNRHFNYYKTCETECSQLKQQLAEKDEKIKKLKSENHALMSDNAYQEADIFELNSFKEYYKNNKISFCIEKLEQVKKYAQHIQGGLINYIDNQIEELKKEMK